MTFEEIAQKLVEGCREGLAKENLSLLYADDAVSVEPRPDESGQREAHGRDAIRAKHIWWEENFTVHSASVEGPFPGGDGRFAVLFELDAEVNATGARSHMKEVALYTVADGKITREEFFYAPGA
ncbi:MAG: hypothetical protein CSA72_04625 [Rhodobacterales bacterium]|nr:MAG: hypothetical protein CSA72_04625 [Rhodobacterales bacterium]